MWIVESQSWMLRDVHGDDAVGELEIDGLVAAAALGDKLAALDDDVEQETDGESE